MVKIDGAVKAYSESSAGVWPAERIPQQVLTANSRPVCQIFQHEQRVPLPLLDAIRNTHKDRSDLSLPYLRENNSETDSLEYRRLPGSCRSAYHHSFHLHNQNGTYAFR